MTVRAAKTTPNLLGFGTFELVKSPSNRLPVDAELDSKFCLVLTSTNATSYPLDICFGHLGWRSHTIVNSNFSHNEPASRVMRAVLTTAYCGRQSSPHYNRPSVQRVT